MNIEDPLSTVSGGHSSSRLSEPKVAVVIPCYKQAGYLAEAVQSIVDQDYKDWQIVIINDGSPDDTTQVAEQLIESFRDFPIKLIVQQNKGPAAARNHGISETASEYILPLDADDKIHPSMLGKCVSLLDQHKDIAIAYCDWQYFGTQTHVRQAPEYNKELLCLRENLFTCTSLFRRVAWERTGGFNNNMRLGLEDWDFWVGCAEQGFYGRRIPEVLFYYRAKDVGRNVTVQPHVRHMFARMVLNHPKLYPAELVVNAERFVAEAEASLNTSVKSSGPYDHAMSLLAEARRFVESGQLNDGLKLIKRAVAVSQDKRVIAEAGVLMAIMKKTPESRVVSQPQMSLPQAIEALKNDPKSATAVTVLQRTVSSLVQLLQQAPSAQTQQGFSRIFPLLLENNLQTNSWLLQQFETRVDGPDSGYSFLLRCVVTAPWQLPTLCGLELIPADLRPSYIKYLLALKDCCSTAAERETIVQHFLRVTGLLLRYSVSAAPQAEKIQALLSFARFQNCIALYTCDTNLLPAYRGRARVLERWLELSGHKLAHQFPNRRVGPRRPRIGFLSQHYGKQTETFVTLSTLQIDREKFEIHLFSLTADNSPTENYAKSFAESHTILPADIAAQVGTIRGKDLDGIIVGTNVTAVTNPVCLLALHRLARVQIISYCSPTSTGFTHADYFILGNRACPPGVVDQFSEKPLLLEGTPGCLDYSSEDTTAERSERSVYGLAPSDLIFINAASCFKITPEALDCWVSILAKVPGSRLLLMPFNPNWAQSFPQTVLMEAIAQACLHYGVDRSRIVICPGLPSRARVKEVERLADIYLDVFPFSGSLSVIDPLEVGVPVVTLAGATFRSNFGGAILSELGLDELVVADVDHYRDLAVRLGSDSVFRTNVAEKVRSAMTLESTVTRPAIYGKRLSEALQRVLASSV